MADHVRRDRCGCGGKRVLLEQFGFGHAEGSSHGGSRIFRLVYGDARYVRMAVAAGEAWGALERGANDRLLYRSGGLGFSTDPEYVATLQAALNRAGQHSEVLSAAEVERRFPAFRMPGHALYQADGGVLAAGRCVAALQRLAYRRGAVLRERKAARDAQVQSRRLGDPFGAAQKRAVVGTREIVDNDPDAMRAVRHQAARTYSARSRAPAPPTVRAPGSGRRLLRCRSARAIPSPETPAPSATPL